jgi:NAD-dependent dihydropyrimidine dehydrogenase PreA subunit
MRFVDNAKGTANFDTCMEVHIMAHKIDKEVCVGCGSCKDACPMDAIKADGDKFMVDADVCVDCGACEGACPTGAIK